MSKVLCTNCGSDNTVVTYFPWIKVPTEDFETEEDFSSKKLICKNNVEIDGNRYPRMEIICMDCGKHLDKEISLSEFSYDEIIDLLELEVADMEKHNAEFASKPGYEVFKVDTIKKQDYLNYNLNDLLEEVRKQLNELKNTNANIVKYQYNEKVNKTDNKADKT